MYFKIENKESKLYKEVYEHIMKKRAIKKANFKKVEEYLDVKFKEFISNGGGFKVIPRIMGIKPIDGKQIEGMKPDNDNPDYLVPNLRTKRGKEISHFLYNLPNIWYEEELNFFPMKRKQIYGQRFSLPYIELFGDVILVILDDLHEPKETKDFIEITTSEFKKIHKSKNAKNQ